MPIFVGFGCCNRYIILGIYCRQSLNILEFIHFVYDD